MLHRLPTRSAGILAGPVRRRRRLALVGTALSAALVLNPTTVGAFADDAPAPSTQPSPIAASADPSADASADPGADPTPTGTSSSGNDQGTDQATAGPSETSGAAAEPATPKLAAAAAALAPLQCDTVYSIQGASPRNLWSVDTAAGTQTSVGTFSIASNANNLNGLGVSADGGTAYGVIPDASGSGRSIYASTRSDGSTSLLGSGVASAVTTHGAVNPVTGFYYYGGVTSGTLNIYGFNTSTGTSIGLVASGSIPNGGGNGDWAFDSQGRLYVVAGNAGNNVLSVVDQAIPTTTQATPVSLSATQIAVSTAAAAINGMAFGGDGYLYISSATTIYKINPSSGATVSSAALSQSGSVDLASCATPSTLEVRKTFPDGRAAAGDQATLSISGGGLASAVTATTAGSDSGLQNDPTETAGPVLALNGTTYTISESGAGTSAAYSASWACVNSSTSATLASGTGTTGTVTIPAGTASVPVLCTFTDGLSLDLGDAPASYGTTKAADGPRHALVGYDAAAHTSTLMLGAHVDTESDGAPTAGANGDDAAGIDDEDALPSLTLTPGATTATATVPVVNGTGSTATLYGWIDTNGNGTFQASEAATVAVPNGATTATLSWSGLPAAVDGAQPVVRLRLTSAMLTDTAGTTTLDERSQGTAPDGEVEDSLATVATVLPSSCSDPFVEDFDAGAGRASLPAGQTTYSYAATGYVQDGSYALVPGITPATDGYWWHTGPDHTPGDVNGRMMLINASLDPGKFFSKTFTGLDVGSQYDFSAWITNANAAGSPIRPNVTFRVVDPATQSVLATVSTGNIQPTAKLTWTRYALTFQATQPTVRLELVNNAPGGSGNDLAIDDVGVAPTCEHGDAPDSYGTLLASNGPVHGRGAGLSLGATVDYEGDGVPSATANGDDTAGVDDEDGVTSPITVTTGSPASVTVNATNSTLSVATLAGWIDLDHSGTFDADERSVVTVPAVTPVGAYPLTFPAATTTQATYARFRLYPGVVADPQPLGAADAGEVEDYPVTVLNPSLKLTKTSDATASSGPGDTVHYTVTLTNTGTGDFTAGNPARLVDDLTGVLDDATYQGDAAASVDGSAVTAPTYAAPRISWSGALSAGKSVVVRYSVDLKGGGDGHVRNTAFAPRVPDPGPTPDCSSPTVTVPCARSVFELPKLTIKKTSNRTQLPSVGQTIVYTVTVTNSGLGDYTAGHPATFADDLTAVLDDTQTLTPANISANRGTATFASPQLAWTGALPAGQSATITYTLTYTGAGDHQLDNSACLPVDEAADPLDACRTVSVPGSGLRHHKSVDPASGTAVDVGQVLTYTLTFENVGPADASVDTSDDLADVLDDAVLVGTPNAGTGLTADVQGDHLFVHGTVPAGATRTVTYQVQVRPFAQQGDHELANVLACEPAEPSGCAPETTSNPVRHLTLTKTSDATVESRPGDQVTYTVTATNDGTGDWTATDQARLVDDLSGLLDDATFGGSTSVSSGATSYSAPRLTWTGSLAHGDTVTITYTVTLTGGGDGQVDNAVWQPGPGRPGPTPDCASTPLPCAEHDFDLPKLTLRKTSNRAQLPAAGQQITYTVTVKNPGPGDYTATNPATFSDDLTDVLDDATFDAGSITASTGTAVLDGNDLDWTGVLAAGDSATVTYTLTYQDSPTGNHVVDNRACIPVAEAADADDVCRTVHTPGSGLQQTKKVNPKTGTPVEEGQELTYTLTFENVGPAAATVDTFDDLSDVVDDATLDGASVSADTGLTATPTAGGDRIDITGSVPTGETLTVTYTVTVKEYADQGNHVVTNALACEPGDPQPCDPTSTRNPVRHLTLTKTSDGSSDAAPGDTVSYTVRVTNDGAGDFTAGDPATVVDDLTDVLDDATFTGVAHASAGADPSYDAPRLTWTGPLSAGSTVRITYEAVLSGGGDHHVANTAWAPADPADPGATPDCASTSVPCADTSFDLPHVVPAKASTPASGTPVQPGDLVTYTLTWTNDGLAAGIVDSTDDLSGVLDDAEVVQEPTSSDAGVDAVRSGTSLRVTGAIAAADTVTVSYQVRVKPSGQHSDNRLRNVLTADNPPVHCSAGTCTPEPPSTTDHPVGELDDWKTVDPASGSTVRSGGTLTYTLHFANTGEGPVDVDRVDDLTGVLDDAALVSGPTSSSSALTLTGPASGKLSIAGTLPAGSTATVTYAVKVRPDGARGDDRLGNFLLDRDQQRPSSCTGSNPARMDCTVDYVSDIEVTKTAAGSGRVSVGDRITYTLTFRNTSRAADAPAVPVDQVDHLDDVLDDARWTSGPSSGSAALTATRSGDTLHVTGALGAGQVVTVTYAVTVTGHGDGRVRNVVAPSGEVAPPCASGSPTCTVQSVSPAHASDLPDTGAPFGRWLLPVALLSLLVGLGLVLGQRRRQG